MMKKLFVLVVSRDNGYRGTSTDIDTYNSTNDVLEAIGDLQQEETVDRVFEMDEYGNVTHYDVVFKGRLELEKTPGKYRLPGESDK